MNKEFPGSFSSQNEIWHQPPSLRLASIDRGVGWADATFIASSEHLNPKGMLHGGIIAGLLDLIMANAAGSHTDPEKIRFAVTLSLSMNFIGSASDGPLELRAETTGGGKRTCFCDGRIKDMDGNLIELMDLGYMYYVLGWVAALAGGPVGEFVLRRRLFKQYYE